MGVNGLWQVLQPCARPTNLATLNRKRLAVDASIWIYQFLKAVRDKEGNALRNSHVVGFFRRICKLLWFGILPVFVFDGGAPALKRATIQGRKRRREGRREDAARTAGKLLAVQMHRLAEEQAGDRRRRLHHHHDHPVGRDAAAAAPRDADVDGLLPGEALPSAEAVVYADEAHMTQAERQRSRKFYKKDAYHLPELDGGIAAMGRPEDPRIMSVDELEEYARHFHNGEDINLYDFSKIDFDGDFFKSLPAADRYNILNAARLRSRLRMGLSKDQLDTMFPDRMAFSQFQIQRVQERNHLTQRLMFELNMGGADLTVNVNARVAGERDREYILVKNDGAEGGWALGVVSKEKDMGQMHKPIDVDALQFQYQKKEAEESDDDDEDFEDVPIEGLNRLPKLKKPQPVEEEDDSLFVEANTTANDLFGAPEEEITLLADEDEDLSRAIAMSLESQHGGGAGVREADEREDLPAPEWKQKAAATAKPIPTTSGKIVAHIVNNRANAAVPKWRPSVDDSDSDEDFGSALAAVKKKAPAPIRPNVKNPFGGPLPFEKLDWRTSIFEKRPAAGKKDEPEAKEREAESDEEDAGGFQPAAQDDEPRPLPPWMVDNTDIRDAVQRQQATENELNAEDREFALEEERLQRKYQDHVIEVDSSDGSDSDVEILDAPPTIKETPLTRKENEGQTTASVVLISEAPVDEDMVASPVAAVSNEAAAEAPRAELSEEGHDAAHTSESEIEFEDVELPSQPATSDDRAEVAPQESSAAAEEEPESIPRSPAPQEQQEELAVGENDEAFADGEYDEFSDPEDEELLAQMAEEAEEHARFASTLNHKSAEENQAAYERELKALRSQQKKDRRDADEVTQIMVAECQMLLRLFGIPYITAPMEAEAQCAELVSLGLVDGIVTDDSDIFLFGGTKVYKNMFNSNKFVECYLGADLERDLSLSREQLISLAQLLGSDYAEGLPGVGPVTAVEILSEFPGAQGLAGFRAWWEDVQQHGRAREADAGSAFRRKFRKAQAAKLFLPAGFPSPAVREAYLGPVVDHSAEPFRWGVPDLDGLRRFLTDTIGWGPDRTDEVLVPVVRDMNRRGVEGTQANITRYLAGGAGSGTARPVEAFAPRQRAGGSKRMAAAVSRLRDSTTAAAGAAAAAEEASSPGVAAVTAAATGSKGRKRKARAPTVVEEEDEEGEGIDGAAGDGEYFEGQQDGQAGRGKGKGKKARGLA